MLASLFRGGGGGGNSGAAPPASGGKKGKEETHWKRCRCLRRGRGRKKRVSGIRRRPVIFQKERKKGDNFSSEGGGGAGETSKHLKKKKEFPQVGGEGKGKVRKKQDSGCSSISRRGKRTVPSRLPAWGGGGKKKRRGKVRDRGRLHLGKEKGKKVAH